MGDEDSLTPTQPLAGDNSPFATTTHLAALRLRMSVEVTDSSLSAGSQAFSLQYATDTAGPWTDVGGLGSAEVWRGFDNPSVADGATSTTLLATSTVAASYEEANPSVVNPNAVGIGQRAEWDWVLQPNGADASTTYFFRMVRSDGTVLEAYTLYPQLTTPPALVLSQQDYRWFDNLDGITPTTALAGENTLADGITPQDVVRLRMNVSVSGAGLGSLSRTFKLQFATSTGGPWSDLGGSGSAAVWRGFDNAAVSDGATLPTVLLAGSTVAQTYEEFNPSAPNPTSTSVGQVAEWDWVIEDNSAPSGTYFLRMVEESGATLSSYTNFPEIVAAAPFLDQQDYRWFANTDSVTPVTPLVAENTLFTEATHGLEYRLRMNVEVQTTTLPASGQSFKLQYATSTGGPWADVGSIGSGETWRGFDNPSVADGTTITTLLANSTVAAAAPAGCSTGPSRGTPTSRLPVAPSRALFT